MTDRTVDQGLISRLQGREERAVRELAERFGSRIYQLAMRQLRNQQDAEEATQDVLLKVHQKIGTFRGASALSSWIYLAPIVLRDIEGLTTQEVGRRLTLKNQTLKSRLHRGRLMLRDRLRQFEGGLLLHARAA